MGDGRRGLQQIVRDEIRGAEELRILPNIYEPLEEIPTFLQKLPERRHSARCWTWGPDPGYRA